MRVGYNSTNITPKKNYPMAGYALRPQASIGVHDFIYASSIVIDDGKLLYAISSIETLGTPTNLIEDVRNVVSKLTPIPKDAIQLGAIHTHSAPESFFENEQCYDKEYYDFLKDSIVQSIVKAYQSLRNVTALFTQTSVSDVASYRDRPRTESKYNMACQTIIFKAQDTRINDVVVSFFACHPTVLNESNLYISSDLVYGFRNTAKQICPNTDFLLINGACADLSTRYTRNGSSYDEVERLGSLWATAVIDSFQNAKLLEENLRFEKSILFVPPAEFFNEQEKQEVLKHLEKKIAECIDLEQRREYISCREVLLLKNYGQKNGCNAELRVLKIGSVVLCSLPFEYAAVDSDKLKKYFNDKFNCTTVLCGYSNGYEGYLPSERPLDKDSGYEDMASFLHHDSKLLVAKEFESLLTLICL